MKRFNKLLSLLLALSLSLSLLPMPVHAEGDGLIVDPNAGGDGSASGVTGSGEVR